MSDSAKKPRQGKNLRYIRKRFEIDGQEWAHLHLLELKGVKNQVIFAASIHGKNIRDMMTHAAKAVNEVDWMIDALKKRFPKEAEKAGVE